MMKRFSFLQYFLVGSLTVLCTAFFLTNNVVAETITLTQEKQSITEENLKYDDVELFDLMSPSSVNILQHVEGTVIIPSFIIDSEDKTIVVDDLKEPTILENVSENLLGSGFFVSPDGYIVTSAHIASLSASKLVIIDSFIQKAISEATNGKDVEETIDELFTKEIVDFMLEKTDFDLQMNLIVLNPEEATIKDDEKFNLYDLGFVAKVLVVNDVFYKEGYDLSLLKISGENYPAASISKKESIDLGDKMHLFQSQSISNVSEVREFAGKKLTNTLSSGIVVRENTVASSSVYELDLSASAFLGGSMVFGVNGEILGVASYDASSGLKDSEHVFVIPNNTISKVLSLSSSTAFESVFYRRIKEGLLLERDLKCEDAHTSFAVALGASTVFVNKDVFDNRVKACNEKLIELQQQNKGFFATLHLFQEKISSMTIFYWMMVAAIFVGIFFIILLLVSKNGKKGTKKYSQDEIPVQSETIKTARRAPLSERMPILHDGNKKINTDIIPPQKEKTLDSIKSIDTKKEEKKETETSSTQHEEKNKNNFHVTTTKFSRKFSLPEDIESMPQKTHGIPSSISEDDKDKLANLWPNKYSNKDKDIKEMVAYPAVSLYIKQTRKIGFNNDEIKKELLRVGWKEEDVSSAFKATM